MPTSSKIQREDIIKESFEIVRESYIEIDGGVGNIKVDFDNQ